MRFNQGSQKIIWDKLAISKVDLVSEGFSADPHSDPVVILT